MTSMNTCLSDRSRPWEYQPVGVTTPVCVSTIYVSLTTKQATLYNQEVVRQRALESTIIGSTVAATIAQSASTSSTVRGQVQAAAAAQQQVYVRSAPICPPSSVVELARTAQTIGLPVRPFTFADCKGNQFVSSTMT
jgi:hypothetical protein